MKFFRVIMAACLSAMLLGACVGGRKDLVRTPSAISIQRGRNYREVIEDFEDRGFTNIYVDPIRDLQYGWTAKIDEVEEILVGGDRNYDAGVWVPYDTPVIIRYHTFVKSREEQQEK